MLASVGTPASATAVGVAFPIIDGILVGLRFYARRYDDADLRIDDWLCLPAWAFLTGCCGTLLTGVFMDVFAEGPFNYPQHRTEDEQILAQVTAALFVLWLGANFCIKLLILAFYRRIFVGRLFNILSSALIVMSIIWVIYVIVTWLLYCGTDLNANFEGGWAICPLWGVELQIGTFAMDNLIDLCLLVLPIPFVWHLQLDLRRRLCVIVIFILGGFAFFAGMNNTVIQLIHLIKPALARDSFFQGSTLLFAWPVIEIGVGLLASNLPHLSLRVAKSLRRMLPSTLQMYINSLRNTMAAMSLSSPRRSSETEAQQPSCPSTAQSARSLRLEVELDSGVDLDIGRIMWTDKASTHNADTTDDPAELTGQYGRYAANV